MSKNLFYASAVIMLAACMFNACDEEDDVLKDGSAGKLSVQNLTTGKEIGDIAQYGFRGIYSSQGEILHKGDTLKVIFTPNNQYKNFSFKTNCTYLNKIEDGKYVVPELSKATSSNDNANLVNYIDTIMVSFMASYKDGKYDLSATKTVKVNRMSVISMSVNDTK